MNDAEWQLLQRIAEITNCDFLSVNNSYPALAQSNMASDSNRLRSQKRVGGQYGE